MGPSFDLSRLTVPSLGAQHDGSQLVCSSQFGGKLVTFENVAVQPQQGAEQQRRQPVFISQVVTEKDFLSRSEQLQHVVQSQGFITYCQKKIDASQTEFEKNVWSFLKVMLGLFLISVPVCVCTCSFYSEHIYLLSHLSGSKGSFISLSVNLIVPIIIKMYFSFQETFEIV